jgi:RNase P subunit RPR2
MKPDRCPNCNSLLVSDVSGSQRIVEGEYVEDIIEILYCPICGWNGSDNDEEYPRG